MFSTVLLAAVLGSSCAIFYSLESRTFTQRVERLQRAGQSVVTFEASSPNSKVIISRASCEALAGQAGVERAGLLVEQGPRDIPELGARISVYTASTSLFPQLGKADGVLGRSLQGTGGRRRITLSSGDLRLLVAASQQPEGIPTNRAIVLPLAATLKAAPVCLAILDRFANVRQLSIALTAELSASGGGVTPVQQLTPTSDPVAEWRSRPGQYAAPVAGVTGGLFMTLLMWTRSGEIAAYRLSGSHRSDVARLLTFEALLTAAVFTAAGALAASIIHAFYVSSPEVLLWIFAGGTSWILASSAGVIRSIAAGAASLTREQ